MGLTFSPIDLVSGAGAVAGLFGGGEGSAKRFRNRQQDFNEYAFKHGVRIRRDDLIDAGINPILAAGGLSPSAPTNAPNAETPSSAKQANTARSMVGSTIAANMASAKQANQNAETGKKVEQLTQTQDQKTKAEIEKTKAETALTNTAISREQWNAITARLNSEITALGLPSAKAESKLYENLGAPMKFTEKLGSGLAFGLGGAAAFTAKGIANMLSKGSNKISNKKALKAFNNKLQLEKGN